MILLPIVERELRVAARRRATYRLRMAVSGIAFLMALWVLHNTRFAPNALKGEILFDKLLLVASLAAIFSGLFATNDAISEERREGTLGLLFLTDLRGHDIVLGKLAACALSLFMSLLAITPILMLSLLHGGVTPGEVVEAAAMLMAWLLLCVGIGLFASSICLRPGDVRAVVLLLGVVFFLLPWFLVNAGASWLGQELLTPALFVPTGALLYRKPVFAASHSYWFLINLTITATYGLLFVALASILVRRNLAERDPVLARSISPASRKGASSRALAPHSARLLRLRNQDPIAWLRGRQVRKRRLIWCALGAVLIIFLLLGFFIDRAGAGLLRDPFFLFLTLLALSSALKYLAASESAEALAEDRKQGALGLVFATPLVERDVLRGCWRGYLNLFRPPVAAVMLFACTCLPLVSKRPYYHDFLSMFGAGTVVLLADLLAIFFAGSWLGLATRSAARATWMVILLRFTENAEVWEPFVHAV